MYIPSINSIWILYAVAIFEDTEYISSAIFGNVGI